MRPSGNYGFELQTAVLIEYRSLGFGDESYGRALSEADDSHECIGSAKLVEKWRNAGCSAMSLGAFDVLCKHVGDQVGEILNKVCARYGYIAVPVAASQSKDIGLGAGIDLASGAMECLQRIQAGHADGRWDPEDAAAFLERAEPAARLLAGMIEAAKGQAAPAPKRVH